MNEDKLVKAGQKNLAEDSRLFDRVERQINSHFFERTGASIEKRKMLETGRASKDKHHPQDFVKDPFVLDFES